MALPSFLMPAGMNSLEALCRLLAEHTGESQMVAGGARVDASGFKAIREIDLTAPGAGNVDTLVHTIPAGTALILDTLLVQVMTAPTSGVGLTNLTLSAGTAAGGAQLLAAQSFAAPGSLPAAGTLLGLTVAQLGASLPATAGNRLFHDGATALNIFHRAAATGGGVASGRVRVVARWFPIA
jgi:hypothetical protein